MLRTLLDMHNELVQVVEALLPGALALPSSASAACGDAGAAHFWCAMSLVRESHGLYSLTKHIAGKIAGMSAHMQTWFGIVADRADSF